MTLQHAPFAERLAHLVNLISGKRFLNMQGLGNEVPFFICPFKANEAVGMARVQDQLTNQLEKRGVQVLRINLYDLCHEILVGSVDTADGESDWELLLAAEATKDKTELKEIFQGILDVETVIVPAMAQRMQEAEFDEMFVSGIGEVFPYIRSHNILNNLQSTAKQRPTVFFFPGEYSQSLEKGASLDLFGRLQDDKYYRAFNIYDCEIE